MNQSRLFSVVEVIVSTVIGFIISALMWTPIAAVHDIETNFHHHSDVYRDINVETVRCKKIL